MNGPAQNYGVKLKYREESNPETNVTEKTADSIRLPGFHRNKVMLLFSRKQCLAQYSTEHKPNNNPSLAEPVKTRTGIDRQANVKWIFIITVLAQMAVFLCATF